MKYQGIGGANTKTGLIFEGETDLSAFLGSQKGYAVREDVVFCNTYEVARVFKQHGFYKFLAERGIDWRYIISKQLLPDNAILVERINTLFVIECKYQQVKGSVDEKLQTCDFKKKQYQKLLSPLNINVQYLYLLKGNWFRDPGYKDVLNYIESVGCWYCFDSIPLEKLGLPVPK